MAGADTVDLFDVRGRVAVVTGAASGIGRGIASGLAHRGAEVVAVDIAARELESLKAECADLNLKLTTILADVASEAAVDALFGAVSERYGRVDVVFANAGTVDRPAPLADQSFEEWRRVHAVNLDGVFLTARGAVRAMQPARSGKIIVTASTWGVRGTSLGRFSAYASSKGALINLTRQLAVELAESGITVNAIIPAGFKTEMAKGLDAETEARLLSRIAMRRFVDADSMVGPAVFLASAASDWVTGHALAVDGGYLAE